MWIARNRNGELGIFEEKPIKTSFVWVSDNGVWDILSDDSLFQEVKWSDSEPRELILKPIEE